MEQAWSLLSSVHKVRLKMPMQGRAIWQAARSKEPEVRLQLCMELQAAEPSPEGKSLAETVTPLIEAPPALLRREAVTLKLTPGVSTAGVWLEVMLRVELYRLHRMARDRA